ncbi:MAG: YicC/YloC family endoribonuclease [Bdellovibrionales bacterium]
MITSMTGYGAGRAQTKEVEIEVTVKSLNGRFLEARCHLPREHAAFERDIKKLLAELVLRGTVDVYVNRRARGQSGLELVVDDAAARRYLKAYRDLAKSLGIKPDPNMKDLVNQPEIMSWRTSKTQSSEKAVLLKALNLALKSLNEERRREGKAAEKHLTALLQKMLSYVGRMGELAASARKELAKRLEERLSRTPVGDKVEPARLNQELAIYLDRADVEEEIHRLREHLRQCQELLKGSGHPGKKLDFYTQELHREVNTIGSKSPLPELTQVVVDAKAVIEQMKEQVQNIV